MAVPVVVDGYNLLYARGEAPAAPARDALVRDLGRWAQRRARRVVVVFDGWAGGDRQERQEVRGAVTLCFTRYGERADDWIARWVASHPEAVVVTSDRAVQAAVSRRGAAVLSSEAFLERLDRALTPLDGEAEPPRTESPRGRRPGRQAAWLRGL